MRRHQYEITADYRRLPHAATTLYGTGETALHNYILSTTENLVFEDFFTRVLV